MSCTPRADCWPTNTNIFVVHLASVYDTKLGGQGETRENEKKWRRMYSYGFPLKVVEILKILKLDKKI